MTFLSSTKSKSYCQIPLRPVFFLDIMVSESEERSFSPRWSKHTTIFEFPDLTQQCLKHTQGPLLITILIVLTRLPCINIALIIIIIIITFEDNIPKSDTPQKISVIFIERWRKWKMNPGNNFVGKSSNSPFLSASLLNFLYSRNPRRRIRCCSVFVESSLIW